MLSKNNNLQLLKEILPNFKEFVNSEEFVILCDNQFNILFMNAYSLKVLSYTLEEVKTLGFRRLADISDENFLLFYELRKKLSEFNRLRLYTKNFDMYTLHVVYNKMTYKNKHYFLITSYKGKVLNKTDFLVSDIYFHSKDAMAVVNVNHRVLSVNHAFTKLFGYYAFEIKGQNILEFISPKNEGVELNKVHRKAAKGHTVNFQSRRYHKDGRSIDLEISIVPIIVNGEFKGAQLIYRDITEIVTKGQDALTFSALSNNFLDGIVIANVNGIISYVNNSFLEMTGYKEKDLIGKRTDHALRSHYHDDYYYENMQKSIEVKGTWQGEIWNIQKDQSIKPYWLQIFSIKSEDNLTLRIVSIYKDLSTMNVNKKILTMLGKDVLTTIPNRTHFIEAVENTLMNFPDEVFHLAFIDINDFKKINDDYGHRVGDLILIEFSQKLLTFFKDQHIARYGGDEFVAFIKCASNFEIIKQKFNAFTESLKSIKIEEYVFDLESSIGFASYPSDTKDVQELIDYADQAMYVSKKNKLPIYKYTPLK